MQDQHIPTELPPFSLRPRAVSDPEGKGGRGGDLRPRKIPLNPPFPKGEVQASTTKKVTNTLQDRGDSCCIIFAVLYKSQLLRLMTQIPQRQVIPAKAGIHK